MDPINKYLIDLGYITKFLARKKAKEKIQIIATHFKCGRVPELKKDYAKKVLREFSELKTKTPIYVKNLSFLTFEKGGEDHR